MDFLDEYDSDITSITFPKTDMYFIPSLRRFTKLKYVDISNLNLSKLPDFPDTVTHLNCSNNNIRELFILPKNLIFLNCSNNLITKIHMIPETLTILECQYNFLRRLPPLQNVTQLFCNNNELWYIPTPNNLEFISCKNNTENVSEYNEKTLIMKRMNDNMLYTDDCNTITTITY